MEPASCSTRVTAAELYVPQDVVKSLKQFKEKKEQLQCNLANKQEEIRAKKCSLGELRAEVAKYRGIQVTSPSRSPAVCSGQSLLRELRQSLISKGRQRV